MRARNNVRQLAVVRELDQGISVWPLNNVQLQWTVCSLLVNDWLCCGEMGRSVVNISFGGGLSQNWSRLQSLNENEMLSIDSCRRESLCSSVRRGRTTSAQSVKLRPENAQCSLTPLLPPPFLYLLSSLLLLHFTLHFFTPFSLALDAKITIPKFPSGLIKYPSIYLSIYLRIGIMLFS